MPTGEELRAEVARLSQELDETNRGVMALYTELDDKANTLKAVSETKTHFLSDISHELRTPLTAVVNLTRLLLARTDGELTLEQERQIRLIRQAVEGVMEMVEDLLDTAKVESGTITLRPESFTVADLFAALRALCRPLVTNDQVVLTIDEPPGAHEGPYALWSDQARIAQVLRNFISNAVKFTDAGEILVKAAPTADDMITFSVCDTGLGIAPEHHARIFEPYEQVDSPVQRRVRGTGLGLPLSRRLAEMLGGRLELASAPGKGSTFSLVIPRRLCKEST